MDRQKLPDFLLIGAQKSASSFLQDCISAHPDVYLPNEETPFFEDYLYNPLDLTWLEDRFRSPKAATARRLGIKRPDYFAQMFCLERIAYHLPNAQLILVLRNPVDRLVSAYFHYAKNGFIPVAELNDGVAALLDGEWTQQYPRSVELLEYGLYGKYLEAWLGRFRREQILLLFHEDVVQDRELVIRAVFKFLNIDPDYIASKALENRPKPATYNMFRIRYLQAIRPLRINKSNNKHSVRLKNPCSAPVSVFAHKFLYQLDVRIFSKCCANVKPDLTVNNRERLLSVYENDLILLSKLLDRNLDHWMK